MHISDGILTVEVAATLGVVSFGFCAYALKKMQNETIAIASAMSALFFLASFIHIPLGPTQIHLLLIGIIGIFLGTLSFISITIALILQALLLGYGGITSLGANIIIMALPAFLIHHIFRLEILKKLSEKVKYFLVGFLGLFLATLLLSAILLFAKDEYLIASFTILVANIPAMILEGVVTLFLLLYIKKSIPKLLNGTNL